MDARVGRPLDRLPGAVDGVEVGVGQRADGGVLDLSGDEADRLEVPGAAGRKAGLDDVDAQLFQGARDFQLFLYVEGAAGGLFAVAQRGVEDDNLIHVYVPPQEN